MENLGLPLCLYFPFAIGIALHDSFINFGEFNCIHVMKHLDKMIQ